MSVKEFSSFVTAQNRRAESQALDQAETVKDWVAKVADLQERVKAYLKPFEDDGKISVSVVPLELNEEFLGAYTTNKLIIRIGAVEAVLIPIGRMIFGAQGRVDLVGPFETKKLVVVPRALDRPTIRILSEEEAQREANENKAPVEYVWKFTQGPREGYTDLNEETFTSALMSVMH